MILSALIAAGAMFGGGYLIKKSLDIKTTMDGFSSSINITSAKIQKVN